MPEVSFGNLAVAAAAMVFSGSAFAVDRLVPQQFQTIQAAIDASANGDVVQVSPGNYNGPVDLRGKAITLRGTGDPSATVVSGGNSVVKCSSGEGASTVVENLTLTEGSAPQGGGLQIRASSPLIRNCHIINNYAELGAGVFCEGGAPRLEGCLIAANVASAQYAYGGGVYLSATSALLVNCRITGNRISVSVGNSCGGGAGAGLYATGTGALRIEGCTVISNQTSISASTACNQNEGAGIYIGAPNTSVTGCTIRENVNSGVGGSVSGAVFANNLVRVRDSKFCGNSGSQLFGAFINLGGNVISATCPSTCPGDLNSDGFIDGEDLARLLSNWGPCTN
jgi:pectin methylesterase-like acyl-CoA thioesterase